MYKSQVQAYEGIAESRNAVILLAGEDDEGVGNGMGSGFFVSADGLALTNYHVIHGTSVLRAWLYDEEDMNYYWVEVKAIDPVADLALVRVKLPPHKIPVPYLQVENDLKNMEVGTDVNAMYNWWGTSDEEKIKEGIFDYFDNSAYSVVDYSNWQKEPISSMGGDIGIPLDQVGPK